MVMITATSLSLLSAMEIRQTLGIVMTNGQQAHAERLVGPVDL